MAKQADSAVRQERDRFLAFSFAAAELLIEVDEDLDITFALGAATHLLADQPEALLGRRLLELLDPQDWDLVRRICQTESVGGRLNTVQVQFLGQHGKRVPTMMGACRLPGDKVKTYLTFNASIPTNYRSDSPTTPAERRRELERRVSATLQRIRSRNETADMTMLRLDGFEALRRRDPAAAEAVQNQMAALLKSHGVAALSVVDDGAGTFTGVHSKPVRDQVLEDARTIVSDQLGSADGLKSFQIDLDAKELSDSDAVRVLLYAMRSFAKEANGELSFGSLSTGASSLIADTVDRVAELRKAVEERAFELVYQPVIQMDEGTISHFEALSRFVSEKPVGEMMDFAEKTGLIEDFDLMVVDTALLELQEKAKVGWRPKIAVNMSAQSLESPVVRAGLDEVLSKYAPCLDRLMIELTETVHVQDIGELNTVVAPLREKGVQFGLDDVGSGTTSLESLRVVDMDFVKLDGSFIADIEQENGNSAFLEAVVTLCKSRGLSIIAEKVETDEQARMLGKFGIGFGQGYHFGRPVLDYQTRYADLRIAGASSAGAIRARRRGETTSWG